jgi:hypothetical protein
MRNAKSLDISDWLKDEINKETRITAIKLLQGVVLNTAVDTGILRGSWLVSVESPNYSIPGGDDKSGAGTISKGVNIIGTAQATDYPTIYIQSRYPYAYRIMELGYSTQTPPKELTKQIKRATNL